jgi:hypothetical protein
MVSKSLLSVKKITVTVDEPAMKIIAMGDIHEQQPWIC